jgi:dolichyl-phosphate beta-glucosyltransferase
MDLSIVIPAFNESQKISSDIIAADNFIIENNFSGEIIIVDDGSSDNTFEIANSFVGKIQSKLKVKKLKKNMGKGAAVKEGILKSTGELIIYADSGLTVPFNNALIGIEMINKGKCEIANGSRKMSNSEIVKSQDYDRKIISKIFNIAVKKLLKIPSNLTDTQCGFKVYKGVIARDLFPNLETSGFLFELEIIILAINKNLRILEFPVIWSCDRDSRISIKKSSKKIIKDFIFLYKKFIKQKIT